MAEDHLGEAAELILAATRDYPIPVTEKDIRRLLADAFAGVRPAAAAAAARPPITA
jgi:hypothetical protein